MSDPTEKLSKRVQGVDRDLNSLGKSQPTISLPEQRESHEPVHLVEDEDTGDRLLIYSTEAGVQVEFRYVNETLWMTQAQIAELFGRSVSVISRHINNIIEESELDESSNVQKMQVANSTKPVSIYSLDMIISVGYRVSSKQATMFRKWATDKLVQFATKGFVIDRERLKDAANFDRIKELREIIRDIRSSEANVYREVRSICSMCSDYDGSSEPARIFYAAMQNKLLWATVGMTGPEVVRSRANAIQPNMGLQAWPNQNIRKSDVIVAHNYLTQPEITEKNRLTTMLLDFFEDRLDQGKLTTMVQAETQLDSFIKFNERPLLRHKGSVKRSAAESYAYAQYDIFDKNRRALRQQQAIED